MKGLLKFIPVIKANLAKLRVGFIKLSQRKKEMAVNLACKRRIIRRKYITRKAL